MISNQPIRQQGTTTAPPPLIELNNIHKTFPGVYALRDVSLSVHPGEVHALVGENGAGKSTLIKIIAGFHQPDSGDVLLDGKKVHFLEPADAIREKIAVVYQELNVVDSLSVAENVFYGRLPCSKYGRVLWKRLYRDTRAVLDRIGFDIDPWRKAGLLSIAQKQMVEIAKAVSESPRLVVMDEPTSALAPTEIQHLYKVVKSLQAEGVGIIYISHKLEEVFALADRITVLRDGQFVGCMPASEVAEQELITMMVGRKLEDMFGAAASSPSCPDGPPALECSNLSTDTVKDISFHLCKGEIIGFSGLMGAGRTELARALFGFDRRRSGTITVFGEPLKPNSMPAAVALGVGMIPESRKDEGVFPNLTVRQNLTIAALKQHSTRGKVSRKSEREASSRIISDLSIKTPSMEQMLANLSGGNQQKVIIGRWLAKNNLRVLIVDEPTRGIDVGAKAEIYALLRQLAESGLGIIVMSSEMPEILGLCDRIYVIRNGRITGEFARNEATQEKLLEAAIG
ncbi:MAG: sugar ABC transporter ATP-binding protein [Planctomycetes bacterium]|nr:sugar ABC transporter ATP-binding protein [Planctomycetota bacterium]